MNPRTDQLEGPWVRTHATKDYYDMAAMLTRYPNIHCTINLTTSLIHQLQDYYVKRLGPFVNVKTSRIDVGNFLKTWKGKTDPWIDLALKPTGEFTAKDKAYLYKNAWNALGTSEVMIRRFPEYDALKTKLVTNMRPGADPFNVQEMRDIKFWFYLAQFDPDFLRGPVRPHDGSATFTLNKRISELDCQRMVVEAFKVMANVIPVHKALRYDASTRTGQAEIITTPFYHPILPLLYDSELARLCQPNDTLPPRFSYPQDAAAQVAKAVKMFREVFGAPPTGMWPGEGAVAQPVLDILRNNGILWTATDLKVLSRSDPPNQANTTPYRFDAGKDVSGKDRSIALVFRDTEISDRIGFKYQTWKGEDAAEDLVKSILALAPQSGDRDMLVTVILDGENAWEWYKQDMDAKEFLHAFYRKLSKLHESKQIIATTVTEYLFGNAKRGIPAHPVEELPAMKKLWPGSWINANYDTWIGEREENTAWEYLLRTRQDLEKSGIKQPDPQADPPKPGTREYNGYMAWEELYASEGSDWFWWYGNDQLAPGGDKPFDDAYLTHVKNVYEFIGAAGASFSPPNFSSIHTTVESVTGGQGAMAQSREEPRQRVLFTVDASAQKIPDAIYIVGDLPQMADWVPNVVRMDDDGTHGDVNSGDGTWSLLLDVPAGKEILYTYTNSGQGGEWSSREVLPSPHRKFDVSPVSNNLFTIRDTFGK